VGLVYLMIAAMICLGLAAPRAGATFLNVADAEELVDDRPKLFRSALFVIVAGLALLLLALARAPGFAEGVVAPGVAVVAIAILLLTSAATFPWMKYYDELDRQLGLEGGTWALLIACAIFFPWAALDAMGWSAPMTSIDVIAVLAASLIAGSFVVAGKRGMMVR
jgi:hypothetical protein